MDHINSITPTSNEEQNNTTVDTVDTDDEQIGEHQTDIRDDGDLTASHTDAYVDHSSDPERLDHDSGTSDVVYSDDDV